MSGPFVRSGDGFRLHLELVERVVLMSALGIIDEGGDAGGRLDYTAHPDDPAADRRYRDLVAGSLEELRREDRSVFEAVVEGDEVSGEAIEAFMRVIGEARLVLAAKLGIHEDGWEYNTPDNPEMAMLGWLGWLQDAAIGALGSAGS
jgi:hypothetical protein